MATDKEIARQLSGFVATAMSERSGEKWEARDLNPDAWGCYLVHVDSGASVFVRIDADRVTFKASYGDLGRDVHPDPKEVKATANRFRDPGELAGVVLKRIVPDLMPEWERVKDRQRERVAARVARDVLTARLMDAQPDGRVDNHDKDRTELSWWRSGAWGADARINFKATEVTMELRYLTPDQAERVLRALSD